MTHIEFRLALGALGMSQRAFASRIAALGGETLPYRTVQSWALNECPIPPLVPAVLTLLRQSAGK